MFVDILGGDDSDSDVVLVPSESVKPGKDKMKCTSPLGARTESLTNTIAQIVSKNDKDIDTMMNKLRGSIPRFDQRQKIPES